MIGEDQRGWGESKSWKVDWQKGYRAGEGERSWDGRPREKERGRGAPEGDGKLAKSDGQREKKKGRGGENLSMSGMG